MNGHVFCHVFNPYYIRKDGTFGSSQKTKRNFVYSQIIGVDIDETGYSSPHQYIDTLRIKPTFWYTSYSHLKYNEEKNYGGPRFRLIYVFNSYIDNPYYFRYCASKLNKMIEEDTGEKIQKMMEGPIKRLVRLLFSLLTSAFISGLLLLIVRRILAVRKMRPGFVENAAFAASVFSLTAVNIPVMLEGLRAAAHELKELSALITTS